MDAKGINLFSSKHAIPNIDPLSLSIKAAQEKKISEARDFFEQLITDYPTCGRFWKIYIEQELKFKNFERAEKLFQRSLLKVLNVELWKCYLNYVRDVKSKMSNYLEKTAQAYDFALDKIGLDVNSYTIWVDYINFLKSVEAAGSFAENQKITAIRKVYQKGVMNPMMNVEQLWKDYCAFENQINTLIAKKMIDDRSREFVTVRKISKEYENVTKNIDRNSPSFQPQGTIEELKQKSLWKKYIEWEKSNPLKSEDPNIVAKRVMFAYEQALLSLATHPDIYYEAASYLQQMSAIMAEKCDAAMSKHYANEAVNLFERAISTFMKNNLLIYLAYCDYEESRLNYSKVTEIYDKLLDIYEIDPSLGYIQYMRFLRRVEGIRSARVVFKRARDDDRISYHVFVATAFMEYFCTKDKTIAYKIFQLGCKRFGHLPEYITAFIEFVTHMNDDETMRNLFETVLASNQIPKERMGEIWNEWLQLENDIGSLEDITRLEVRMLKAIEEANQLEEHRTVYLIDRFKFLDLHPCTPSELKSLGYKGPNNYSYTNLIPHGLSLGQSLATNLALTNHLLASASVISYVPGSTKDNQATKITNGNAAQNDEINQNLTQQTTETTYNSINPFNKFKVNRPRYPCPDVNKMYPYKPNRNTFSGLVPVPGGGLFLFPTIFADMIKRLPSPGCFGGPYVVIDEFLNHFKNLTLPEDYEWVSGSSSKKSIKIGSF